MALMRHLKLFRRNVSAILTLALKSLVLSALINAAQHLPSRPAQHLNSSSRPSSIPRLRSINQGDRTLSKLSRDDNWLKSYDRTNGCCCCCWKSLISPFERSLGNSRCRKRRGRRALEGIPRRRRSIGQSHVNVGGRMRRMTPDDYENSLRAFPKHLQQRITQTDDVEERLAKMLAHPTILKDDTFATFVEQWRTARTDERKVLTKLLKDQKTKEFNYTVAIYQDIRPEEIISNKRESISKLWAKTEEWNSSHRRNQIKMFEMALREEKQADDQEIRQLRINLNSKKQIRTTTTTTIPMADAELETTEPTEMTTTDIKNYLKTDHRKTTTAMTKGVSGGTIGLMLLIFAVVMVAVTLPVYYRTKTREEIPITEEEKKKLLEKKENEKREKEEKKRLKEEKKRKKKEAKKELSGKEQSKKPEEMRKPVEVNQGKANDEKRETGKRDK